MKQPFILTLVSSVACAATAANKAPENTTPTKSKTPNVVFIYADDLGYGDLECYGAKNVQTPNVNRLAKSGILFTNAHATAATSTPSRYSMLTGEYAWRKEGTDVAAGNAGMIIRPEQYTMADMFKSVGYTTAAVGKWHLGLGDQTATQDWNAPLPCALGDLGFDYHYIMAATADRVPCVYIENGKVANYDPSAPIEVSYQKNFEGEPTGKSNPELLYNLKPSHGHDMSIVNGISRIGFMKGGGKALWKDENIADSLTTHAIQFIEENQNKPFLSENKSRMEIVFDHVSFRYPGKEQYILQDFSLKIHAGEKIAIVGLNGSGKTTLVKLLCRFYIPDEGQILLNGRNIYEYNEEEYNSFISAVFQDYKLFSFSLKDNILLGKTENPEDINIALKKSGFSQRLKTLDNGLDTLYSKEFDKNGVELSGGESQKLAIARACYKDAPIIILDEPTASLDAVAEYEIYAGFEKLVENKTAIIISHRLSSTHFCDRIIVINNGTVFEDGTHQSLMAKESGIYKKMFTTQAAHYFSDPTTVAVVD